MQTDQPVAAGPSPESGRSGRTSRRQRHDRRFDLLAVLSAVALAGWVTGGLWLDPSSRAVRVNSSDQAFFEWLLAYGAYAVTHGENPFFTHLINVPDGANLAVNTSVTAYAVLFAPLTYLVGPSTTFLVVLTANLVATALTWYWFLSRKLVRSPLAALVGGLFIAFSPGLVSHANAHLNWTAGWLAPIIVWRVLRLREPVRWRRNGVVLGVLVAVAFTIAAEGLFFIALACAVFLGGWSLAPGRRAEVRAALRPVLGALAVTAGVAAALLAYPLWLHFRGPQRYHGTGFDPHVHSEDLLAYAAFPQRSLAGVAGLGSSLAPNPTEENSFFGPPLLLLTVVCLVMLWRHADAGRRATLGALTVTAMAFTVLSWGPRARINGELTEIPLPYALLRDLPVFNAALPARLALVVTAVIGVVLAFAVDHLLTRSGQPATLSPNSTVAFALALLPLLPAPLLTVERPPVPAFITSGAWRDYVSPGGVLAPVPLTLDVTPDGQRWQAYALSHRQGAFAIPSGFFLGPGGPDGRGRIGPVPRFTDSLLLAVARHGNVPTVNDDDRAMVRADLRHWRVEAVVLADRVHGAMWPVHEDALLAVTTDLLGPPERVHDVWVWRAPPEGW